MCRVYTPSFIIMVMIISTQSTETFFFFLYNECFKFVGILVRCFLLLVDSGGTTFVLYGTLIYKLHYQKFYFSI